MIRFCMIRTEKFYISQITINTLTLFFENNPGTIAAIYNCEKELLGCVSEKSLKNTSKVTDSIVTERINIGENIFDEAHNIFENKVNEYYVPLINEESEIVGFSFEQNDFRYDQVLSFLKILKSGDYSVDLLKYIEGSPALICLDGMNEITYELYQILKKNNSDCVIKGFGWNYAYIDTKEVEIIQSKESDIYVVKGENEKDLINVNSNVVPQIIGENFRQIIKAAIAIGKRQLKNTLNSLNDSISVCICNIPTLMPFVTDWTKAFWSIESVHNKIQGYENYSDKRESSIVKEIYGIDRLPDQKKLPDVEVLKLGNGFVGKSFLEHKEKNRLYIIGPCIVSGYCVPDYLTISNCLQEMILDSGYEVIRIAVSKVNWLLMDKLKMLPIRSRDILLFISENDSFPNLDNKNILYIDTDVCYKSMDQSNPYFSDCPIHLNARGHLILSEYIYENYLKKLIYELAKRKDGYIQKGDIFDNSTRQLIANYAKRYSISTEIETGAIVMNCNPFTNGHLYLIGKAAKMVNFLYVFVVEEDKSFFSFEDRIFLVREGTKNIKNVKVVPSGNFILSYETLPSYFEKDSYQEKKIDASKDIEIFARYIAPLFGIKWRFVGEEPLDKVTRQYNEQMKMILEEYDISLIEIPRKKYEGKVVSASRVREALANKDWKLIESLVPVSTLDYLMKKWR